MLKRLPIRRKLLAMVSIPLIVLIGAGLLGVRTLQQARVGGPRYDAIISSKDLVADVLPPPLFIVEAYLTTYLIQQSDSASETQELIARFDTLEQQYRERHAFWDAQIKDSGLRSALIDGSYVYADSFFVSVRDRFLPLIEQGDRTGSGAVLNTTLSAFFDQHRNAIDQVVVTANLKQEQAESSASSFVRTNFFVLGAAFLLGVLLTALLGTAIARSIIRPIAQLRKAAIEDLPRTVEAIRNSDLESNELPELKPIEIDSGDELADAANAFNAVISTALGLASDQVKLRQHTSEMFVNLGHRNQTFINRQHELIDNIQANVVDPDMLSGLFELDHTVTRMRRNAESLLVLAGTRQARSWSAPVAVSEIIGGAVSEVADMHRVDVTIGGSDDRFVQGSQAFDLSHLIAELVENATLYSSPTTRVDIRVQRSQNRMRIWIMDAGIGMSEGEIADANRRVTEPPGIEELSTDQVGFQVVARLTRRLGVSVRLQDNPSGGLAVNVDLPPAIFAEATAPVSDAPPIVTAAPAATRPVAPTPLVINSDDFALDGTVDLTGSGRTTAVVTPAAAAITGRVPVVTASTTATESALPSRRRAAPDGAVAGASAAAGELPRRRASTAEPAPTDGPRFNLFGAGAAGVEPAADPEANARRLAAFTRSVELGRDADESGIAANDDTPTGQA